MGRAEKIRRNIEVKRLISKAKEQLQIESIESLIDDRVYILQDHTSFFSGISLTGIEIKKLFNYGKAE